MKEAQAQAQVEEAQMTLGEEAALGKKRLSKQLSMCERLGNNAWERKRVQERRRNSIHNLYEDENNNSDVALTDDDLKELKGCIELGFGFNEEDGQTLCNTLPALDLYFAVNRQVCPSPVSTPDSRSRSRSRSHSHSCSSFATPVCPAPSPPTPDSADSWKICNPGDDPEHVKTKLRHWAQAVACSVMQSH
ncbi:hypothetical protein VNO77_18507 [Canavalia gladiata]|uniref:Uncharacterized protein n=1 Tax=Canavalia gladiata TaxID=3824 RepID=A0AAN9LLN1_CANGL